MDDANAAQRSAREVVIDALDESEADWFEPRTEAADRILDALTGAGYTLVADSHPDPHRLAHHCDDGGWYVPHIDGPCPVANDERQP